MIDEHKFSRDQYIRDLTRVFEAEASSYGAHCTVIACSLDEIITKFTFEPGDSFTYTCELFSNLIQVKARLQKELKKRSPLTWYAAGMYM